jgi:hypothetical protein
MKTVPISGTLQSVTFFEDDTIETVRQLVALAMGSHPDRLFMEVKTSLPKDYYATNPLHWTNLFLRLSLDGKRITAENLKTYIKQTRPTAGILEKEITREQWEDHDEYLQSLFSPDTDFEEWRVLGVEEVKSFVLPLPPRDLPLQAASRPQPQLQSLYETHHPYDITEVRATQVPDGAAPGILLNYYPRLRRDTAPNIETLRTAIESAQSQLSSLLALEPPKHQTVSVVRAKWYIPLISTKFTAPRTRFEQIFYGMTVSPTTPYVGYFTAKTETTRHKFYCKDTTAKKPILDIPMWKSWTSNTMPQRRIPTLLLYRGKSRVSFDRIAVTDRDIIVDVRREKDSTETMEELRKGVMEWMETLDALVPFLTMTDVGLDRWELSDLSVVATYSREIREFDMLRFPCLQKVFGFQNEAFRLLRAEHTSDDIRPEELQALQILNQEDADKTPEYLAKEMGIPLADATELFTSVMERSEELNLEKSLKAYPTIKFSPKEVIIKFVTDLDRTIKYVNILRHVLTSDSEEVDAVCPKRMERVVANVAIPQQEIQIEGAFAADDDFNALLGFGAEEAVPEDVFGQGASNAAAEPPPAPKGRKVKVTSRAVGTYNYFNNRLQSFDAATFDKSIYPNKCDKPRQVVVLTPGDKSRVGSTYDFSTAAENEKLELTDPQGTAICPPYWCIRDEIPLLEDQLVTKEDGLPHCPVCDGKVRTSDSVDMAEFPVIKRDTAAKFPDYLKAEFASSINKRRIPCCFQTPRPATEVLAPKEEATYVLSPDSANVGPLRFAYLESAFADRIGLSPNYAKTVKKGRLASGESDVFRVGLGRPSKTLPALLDDKTPILRPREAKENVLQCSFFRSWKDRKDGDNEIDRIVSSIDAAYQQGGLSLLEELEYVTTFLKAEVIRVDMESGQVICGFWAEGGGATSRTVVLLGNTLLAQVSRKKVSKGYATSFTTDLRKPPFAEKTLGILRERHTRACSINVPVLADAIAELMAAGKSQYQVILDPFQRIQAVFVPGQILLPVQPTSTKPDMGVAVRNGYADIQDEELPKPKPLRAFLATTKNEMFRLRSENANTEGMVVEFELVSGFRIPIEAYEAKGPEQVKEVAETIQRFGEDMLVNDGPNEEDLKLSQEIAYSSEIYEFLMFSLSKDILGDASGEALDETYRPLRNAIKSRSADLLAELNKWFKKEAYEDNTKSPVEFVNKVRTPCGQYKDKDSCNKSSLCGWNKNDCKIRVKPIVDKNMVLRRLAKTLASNDKQRALVLDGRMSPFFSTVLYLEMPHELITTSV